MKKIKSFADWNLVNEAKLYYLSQFGKALDNAPEEFKGIVKDLKDMWGKESGLDMTMFELDGDMLTYTSGRNIDPNFSPSVDDINRYEKQLLSGNRSLLKIGRLLNNTINKPKKYPESLINRFVVYLQSSSKDAEWTIKLVKGDEIAKYYDSSNYSNENKWGSSLWQSCMTDKEMGRPDVTTPLYIDGTQRGTSTHYGFKGVSRSIFDIYTKNPEVCSLAVMLDSNGKLGARALVWNVTSDSLGSFQFMDRVYSTGDWMVDKMRRWAVEGGMAIRLSNMGYNCETIAYKDKVYDDVKMSVDVKKIYYKSFPYLDTFNRYDVKSGKLLNWTPNDFKGFGLQTTSGDRTSTGFIPTARNYIRRFNQ